ncbi:aminotransferase [Aurantimonas marianensis]|uniref:aminotransferase n=1 Tax=Aurantimonas marianensis TaxID=2920428 RepID=UPI002112E27B|nr:aminotransferase [Aurantimonas marianensis]
MAENEGGRPTPRRNPLLAAVTAPPIARAGRWIESYDGAHGAMIDCSQAVPDHAPPAEFAERLAVTAASQEAARYGDILGDQALRAAYASHVSSLYRSEIAASRVAITAGCNQAFFAAMLGVAQAGDAVVLPAPWYFNHKMTLEMLGIEARVLPLQAETGFLPVPSDVEALIDDRCRALVLVSPNNPTGAVYPPDLLAELLDVCVRRSLTLVLDETYRDFLAPESGAPHRLFGSAAAREHLVSLYSFSKSYAIPGHRVGAMIAGSGFIAQMEKVIDCVQICAPRPTQAALPWAIPALADWRGDNRHEIAKRAGVFREETGRLDGWALQQIGAYFAYVRHPWRGLSAEAVAEALMRDLGVLVLPGSFFGPSQEDHLRIAFANVPVDRIRELARRLALGLAGGFRADDQPHATRTAHG